MKTIKLLSMELENFKGIKNFSLVLNGNSVNVYGDNAVGKSTLFDGFVWLLFDKDSHNDKDFSIKTLNANGNELHNLNHSVQGLFEVDGTEVELKKVYKEVWTRKRGSAESTFTGHETDYYIDGVPKKKKEYTEFVDSIVKEDLFKLITSPTFFNEQLKWKDRRDILLTISGDVTDEEVFATNKEVAALPILLKGRAIDDHRKVIAERRKKINEELLTIPVRIDEITKSIPESNENLDELKGEVAGIQLQIDQANNQINNIRNGNSVKEKELHITELTQTLRTFEHEFLNEETKELREKQAKWQEAEQNVLFGQREIQKHEEEIKWVNENIQKLDRQMEELRNRWNSIDQERFEFHGNTECPTCGQALQKERVDEVKQKALEAFNLNKSNRLQAISAEGNALKERKLSLEDDLHIQTGNLEKSRLIFIDLMHDEQNLANELDGLESNVKDVKEESEYKKLHAQIDELKSAIQSEKEELVEVVQGIESEIADLRSEMREKNTVIAAQANVENLKARIQELTENESLLAAEFQKLDHELHLTEEFIRAKVDLLTDKINGKFKLANFKLFENQINGGLQEVCETTYNGVDYSSLNNAMRINVGLDIIQTLSEHYGIYAPIFVDNAEAVTKLNAIDTQIVSLIVSEQDKTLRVEESQ
ncbi:AAA family ATPase [Paenisporosarcina cavernae]|uniref:Nuclease SbcCD subunit C n=1 Tax=Paenisporosarcina cavernae TaxID=2320858 RepID=A0A385YVF2_9BACL|nr:AAA family ATPase [Paenisporosarcina cavernae]AYC29668.1 hypothetical protein D3873_07105 [Paenisporosarcina cavernae]